jgi:hypothetical protein
MVQNRRSHARLTIRFYIWVRFTVIAIHAVDCQRSFTRIDEVDRSFGRRTPTANLVPILCLLRFDSDAVVSKLKFLAVSSYQLVYINY